MCKLTSVFILKKANGFFVLCPHLALYVYFKI